MKTWRMAELERFISDRRNQRLYPRTVAAKRRLLEEEYEKWGIPHGERI